MSYKFYKKNQKIKGQGKYKVHGFLVTASIVV